MPKKFFFCGLISIFLFLFVSINSVSANKSMVQKGTQLYAAGALTIKVKEGVAVGQQGSGSPGLTPKVGLASIDALNQKFEVYNFAKMFPGSEKPPAGSRYRDMTRYYEINFPFEIDIDSVASEYRKDPNIERVDLIPIEKVQIISNDPSLGSQYHIIQGQDHDMDITEAWEREVGDTTVILAIIDTGVLYSHPDLGGSDTSYTKGNIWINKPEYYGTPGVDDDGNGKVDDIRGWDWVTVGSGWPGEDVTFEDNDPKDFNGHGTHLAGIAAAITNNGIGVAGIAGGWYDPNDTRRGCKIMCLRVGWSDTAFVNCPGPSCDTVESGYIRMDYAGQAMEYARLKGAIAFNCSWGSSFSPTLDAAVTNAILDGILISKSAGNSGTTSQDYLNSILDVTSVASSTSSDKKSGFSNYGSWIDLAAPGSSIYSTYSVHYAPAYAFASGTSMSAPMVVGVAGLFKSKNPFLSGPQIEELMKQYADSMPTDFYYLTDSLGAGRLNANDFLVLTPTAKFGGSPRAGKAPLLVNFSDSSTGTIDTWSWNFGDAGTSGLQNPSHSYTNPGLFSPRLTVSHPDFGLDTRVKTDYIAVLDDSVYLDNTTACFTGTRVKITVSGSNLLPTNAMFIPLRYGDGTTPLICDSVNFVGSRVSFFDSLSVTINSDSQTVVLDLNSDSALTAGEGLIANLYFSLDSATTGESLFIDTAIVSGQGIEFTTSLAEYDPDYKSGYIEVYAYCRGDVTKNGSVSPSDVVFLVNHLFKGGPAPDPLWLGDLIVNGQITPGDLIYLINFVFRGGPPPP